MLEKIVAWLSRPVFGDMARYLRSMEERAREVDGIMVQVVQEQMSQSEEQSKMAKELGRIATALESMAAPLLEEPNSEMREAFGSGTRPGEEEPLRKHNATPGSIADARRRWNVPMTYRPLWGQEEDGRLIGWEP